MKISFKKTRWLTAITMLCLIVANLFAITSCDKPENQSKTCNVDNPLTDLPWLKAKVDEITLLFQDNHLYIAIYKCMYSDEQTGFLEDRGNIAYFYNCEGETLCIMGGDAGETCSDLNIVSKELIWEINK